MTDFNFTELVNDPPARVESAALGADANGKFVTADAGKAVKLAASDNYVLAVQGDEIEGFVNSVEPFTVNSGFSFGTVQRDRRMECVVGANQGATPMAIGDLVVADAQTALGTAGKGAVITGTPTSFLWRVLRIVGTGVTGDTVLIERV